MQLVIGAILKGLDRCPHCGIAVPLLTQEWVALVANPAGNGARSYATYKCSRCCRVVMAEGQEAIGSNANGYRNGASPYFVESIYPKPVIVDASLPEDARRYLKQAIDTVFAPDASIVMSAAAIDAMLKEKGYEEGSLYSRIDQAVKDHVLTESMGTWAHKVRLDANAVRHADGTRPPVDEADARKVLEFSSALGDFLFVFSARVSEGIKDAGHSVALAGAT